MPQQDTYVSEGEDEPKKAQICLINGYLESGAFHNIPLMFMQVSCWALFLFNQEGGPLWTSRGSIC